jgi:hypothetical protein
MITGQLWEIILAILKCYCLCQLARYVLSGFLLIASLYVFIFTEMSTYQPSSSYSGSIQEVLDTSTETGWNTSLTNLLVASPSSESHGLTHSCTNCGKAYLWRTNLIRHMKLECGKVPQQQCPYCPYISNHKSNVKKHIHRLHKNMPNI